MALTNLYQMTQGERPTEREVLRWYRVVVMAESRSIEAASVTLGVNHSTLYRQARQLKGLKERTDTWVD